MLPTAPPNPAPPTPAPPNAAPHAPVAYAGLNDLGRTLGVEEEYHLLDPETGHLMNCAELSDRALAGEAGSGLHPEMLTSQLEAVTAVCTDLDQVRSAILGMRRSAAAAAADYGATILATSTHPFASLTEVEIMGRPRYQSLIDRFGTLVSQFNLCGCHVHVSVPDLETAVAVMNHARAYLPVLAALTGSSPFHQGVDTGYDSFRLAWLALWPQGGPPPILSSAQEYQATVADCISMGIVQDASALLWDLRPSSRYPTLEFRSADVCTDIDDAVLYAGTVRSLVRVLGARVAEADGSTGISEPTLRAARWRAARYGLSDTLWSPARAQLVPAGVALDDLMGELRADLEAQGEYDVISELHTALRRRGTSATRQRQTLAATDSLQAVAQDMVRLTSRSA